MGEYAYLPGRVVQRVSWPAEWCIVVATSGVKATKTGNAMHAYNRVADSVRALVSAWNADTGRAETTLAAVLASSPDAMKHLTELAPRASSEEVSVSYLVNRVAQYAEETSVIVPGMIEAIAHCDADTAGRLMARSQRMAEEALQNQVPQTTWLAAHARDHGAVGATAFGAGFGGAVWALVAADLAERFAGEWMAAYAAIPGAGHVHHDARVLMPAAGASRKAG